MAEFVTPGQFIDLDELQQLLNTLPLRQAETLSLADPGNRFQPMPDIDSLCGHLTQAQRHDIRTRLIGQPGEIGLYVTPGQVTLIQSIPDSAGPLIAARKVQFQPVSSPRPEPPGRLITNLVVICVGIAAGLIGPALSHTARLDNLNKQQSPSLITATHPITVFPTHGKPRPPATPLVLFQPVYQIQFSVGARGSDAPQKSPESSNHGRIDHKFQPTPRRQCPPSGN